MVQNSKAAKGCTGEHKLPSVLPCLVALTEVFLFRSFEETSSPLLEVFEISFLGWAPCTRKHLCLTPWERVFEWLSGITCQKIFPVKKDEFPLIIFLITSTTVFIVVRLTETTHCVFDQQSSILKPDLTCSNVVSYSKSVYVYSPAQWFFL